MTGWSDLERELDAWETDGRAATLWWRDDDAVRVSDPLERLLGMSEASRTPIALAVVPRDAEPALGERLAGHRLCSVLQHGYAHLDRAPAGAGKSEFPAHRDRRRMLSELAEGRNSLIRFERVLPVLVPPWNRIDPALLPALPGIGLRAVSTYKVRKARHPAPDVSCTNTHADIVDWPRERRFVGLGAALDLVVGHLSARRCGTVDAEEPTGLLTHHLVHDEACWDFLGEFVARVRSHAAALWLGAREAFWP